MKLFSNTAAPKNFSVILMRSKSGLWNTHNYQASPCGVLPSADYRHLSRADATQAALATVRQLERQHNQQPGLAVHSGATGELLREAAPRPDVQRRQPVELALEARPSFYGQCPPLEWISLNLAALSGYSIDQWQLRLQKPTGWAFLLPRDVDTLDSPDSPPAQWVPSIWNTSQLKEQLTQALAELTGCVVHSSYGVEGLFVDVVEEGAPLYGDWEKVV